MLLGACNRPVQPTAQDLTACGTVNNMVAGTYVADPLAEQEASVATLIQQADLADNTQLITAANQLRADTEAGNEAGVTAALASLGKTCTSMGVGPSNGGI
jgi:hypothetical protein